MIPVNPNCSPTLFALAKMAKVLGVTFSIQKQKDKNTYFRLTRLSSVQSSNSLSILVVNPGQKDTNQGIRFYNVHCTPEDGLLSRIYLRFFNLCYNL
jgi:hypothetical protein